MVDDASISRNKLAGLYQVATSLASNVESQGDEGSMFPLSRQTKAVTVLILEQHVEELTQSCNTLAKINAELVSFRDHAQSHLEEELNKNAVQRATISELVAERQELLKARDLFRSDNGNLRREIATLKAENQRIVDFHAKDRSHRIEELAADNRRLKDKCSRLEEKNGELEDQILEQGEILREQIKKIEEVAEARKLSLEQHIQDAEGKLRATASQRLRETHHQEIIETELKTKVMRLTNDKEDLAVMLMQKDRLLEEAIDDNFKLKEQNEETMRKIKKIEETL